jgi:hypothetical protein
VPRAWCDVSCTFFFFTLGSRCVEWSALAPTALPPGKTPPVLIDCGAVGAPDQGMGPLSLPVPSG